MLSVSETGSGAPLILLHGWGLHSGVWESSLPILEKYFHCYAVDMLGHGESNLEDGQSFNLNEMREELHQLIKKIDSNKILLLGWSLGGLVAMDYLNHYAIGEDTNNETKKISKLILVTSSACFCKKDDWPHAMDKAVLNNFAEQLELDYKKTVDKFMALQMFGAEDYKQSLKILKKNMASRPMPSIETLRQGLQILKTVDLRSTLKNIRQTVLLISGEHDRLMPYQAANDMQQLINKSEHIMIKGAGHAPFISHPQDFTQAVYNFSKE